MVIVQTANQPIAFSGQIVAYGTGVANTYQEREIVEQANAPINFTNAQGTVQYSQSGSGTSGQQAYSTN